MTDQVHHEEQFCEIIMNLGQWFRRCCLKDFLSGAVVVLLFGGAEPLCNFERGHQGEHSCEVIWNLDQWFRRRCNIMLFKDNSYLELWQPLCSVDRNHLCNFGRRYEEQFCEIIYYLELWRPSCSVEQNHLCNFERGHHWKHSCEVI